MIVLSPKTTSKENFGGCVSPRGTKPRSEGRGENRMLDKVRFKEEHEKRLRYGAKDRES